MSNANTRLICTCTVRLACTRVATASPKASVTLCTLRLLPDGLLIVVPVVLPEESQRKSGCNEG